MRIIKHYFKELILNFNSGMIAYYFHRITGIGLTIYLILHIWTLSYVRYGEEAFNHSLEKWDNTMGHLFEYFLLLAVAFHLFNGIRIMLAEFFNLSKFHLRLLYWSVAICFFIAIYGLFLFFPEIFHL